MALLTERTTFTLDVLGRYTANTWQEVLDSQNQTLDPHARPFDVFILGVARSGRRWLPGCSPMTTPMLAGSC